MPDRRMIPHFIWLALPAQRRRLQTPRPAYRSGQPPLFCQIRRPASRQEARTTRHRSSAYAHLHARIDAGNWDRFATLTPIGKQQVFDLTEPRHAELHRQRHHRPQLLRVHVPRRHRLQPGVAERAHVLRRRASPVRHRSLQARRAPLDDRAGNLRPDGQLPLRRNRHASATNSARWVWVTPTSARCSCRRAFRTTAKRAAAICAAVTAILTGESYATSAEMARELGAFPGYAENKNDMLRVMRNHRRAAYDVDAQRAGRERRRRLRDARHPSRRHRSVAVRRQRSARIASNCSGAAQECWDRALFLGERHGYRNAQSTVIAPTGTIGLLMDCDTTGVEPDFALVKFKKLAGGGYFKIANQSLRPALVNLGYTPEQIHDIIKYVMGTLILHDAPHVNWQTLLEQRLHRSRAGEDRSSRCRACSSSPSRSAPGRSAKISSSACDITRSEWQAPGFNLLRKLGFTKRRSTHANDVICGRGTVEGAPHLKRRASARLRLRQQVRQDSASASSPSKATSA